MKRCFWRFNDLLEEKVHTAKAHATGLEDDECYYTKVNKIPYYSPHAVLSDDQLNLMTLAKRCQRQPALSLISPKSVIVL